MNGKSSDKGFTGYKRRAELDKLPPAPWLPAPDTGRGLASELERANDALFSAIQITAAAHARQADCQRNVDILQAKVDSAKSAKKDGKRAK